MRCARAWFLPRISRRFQHRFGISILYSPKSVRTFQVSSLHCCARDFFFIDRAAAQVIIPSRHDPAGRVENGPSPLGGNPVAAGVGRALFVAG
jgi:hypothetical protein